jgi:hypothetical protein
MQAQFIIPMAASLAFGIVFATLITLILIPSLYLILNDFSVWWKKARQYLLPGFGNETGAANPQAKESGDPG